MGFVILFSLVGNFWQIRQNSQLPDNDLKKCRCIKMYGEVDRERLMDLETLFTYERNEEQVTLIREQAETYERLVKEQAESIKQRK